MLVSTLSVSDWNNTQPVEYSESSMTPENFQRDIHSPDGLISKAPVPFWCDLV